MFNILKKITRNQLHLFLSIVLAFSLIGFAVIFSTPNVTAQIKLGCYYGGFNGALCGSDLDCQSGNCVGGDGTCSQGHFGTCQPMPPACIDHDFECDDNLDCDPFGSTVCTMVDPGLGCPAYGVCLDMNCTNEVPAPPYFLEGYFIDGDTINVTIPAPPKNGFGDHHNLRVVLATQDLDNEIIPNYALFDGYFPLSNATITGPFNISFGSGSPQPVKVGVRNYDNCQGIYGPWRELSPVNPPETPPGNFSCFGATPANSGLCTNDDAGLTVDTAKTLVASCGAPKCEYTCNSGYTFSNGACIPVSVPEVGNVYGWAWSSNVGWIKMNSCSDVAPLDGLPDAGSCETTSYGVRINNTNNNNNANVPAGAGTMTGSAWSDHVGWIKFGGLSNFPTGNGTFSGNAELTSLTPTSGTFKGWGKILTGDLTPGFDGWISLSGANNPSGAAYIDGSKGVTYHPPTARLVGWAWGGEVLGWLNFSGENHTVTYGAPSSTFDYHLSANPLNLTIEKGQSNTTTVTRILDMGATKPVKITATILNPNGFRFIPSASILSNATCSPNCSSIISVSVPANAQSALYTLRVTGAPDDVQGDVEEVNVGVTVPSPVYPPIVASCVPSGQAPYLVNKFVTWTASITSGGLAPFSYTWDGTDNLGEDAFSASVTKTYSTTGNKIASVTIRDSSVPQQVKTVDCAPQVTVVVQPNIIEF